MKENKETKIEEQLRVMFGDKFEFEGTTIVKYLGNESIVKIPRGVRKIEDYAFSEQVGISKISFPNTLREIGHSAFAECTNLKQSDLGSLNLKYLGMGAFEGCFGLEYINLPRTISVLQRSCFDRCKKLKEITLPNNIREIKEYAFMKCEDLKTVNMHNGICCIGEGVFALCSSLETIFLPEYIQSVEPDLFNGCINLKRITIPSGVEKIGHRAFACCFALSYIWIPESVTEIQKNAFLGCDKLVIETPKGSFAETYAKDHEIQVVCKE